MKIYEYILEQVKHGKKMFALLIDPEKTHGETLAYIIDKANHHRPDFIFVGGSQIQQSVDSAVDYIKSHSSIPVVLFPGDCRQICEGVDALLFLMLISGRNSQYLIEQQITASPQIKQSSIEAISTGYILVDGGCQSAVEVVSHTKPYDPNDTKLICATAQAGELIGNKLIYLEAGSGAVNPITKDIISEVKSAIDIPLIVGGGIRTVQHLQNTYLSGADIVVVGNYLEQHPDALQEFIEIKQKF